MESATHPRVIAGRLAPTIDHAGVCEFHQVDPPIRPTDAAPSSRSWRSRLCPAIPSGPIDPVDSCVTNHRIVREHAGGLVRRSWPASGQGARPSVDGRAPRPEASGSSVDCTSSRSNGRARGTARRVVRRADRVSSSTGVSPSQNQRTLKGSRRECRHPGLRDGADVAFSSSGVQPGGNAPW